MIDKDLYVYIHMLKHVLRVTHSRYFVFTLEVAIFFITFHITIDAIYIS